MRPICRTSLSLKRIACPLWVTKSTSSPAPTNLVEIRESPSFRVIAIKPLRLTSLKADASDFFTTPLRVTISKLQSPSSQAPLRTGSTEVTCSSLPSERKFMMDLPFVARRPSGISNILHWYTFPLSVKKSRSLCVEVVNRVVTTSSSLVLRSTTPTPPRFCVLYSDGLVRLT